MYALVLALLCDSCMLSLGLYDFAVTFFEPLVTHMKPCRILCWTALALCLTALPACNRSPGRLKVAFVSNNPYEFWTIAQRGTEKAEKDFDVQVLFRMPPAGGGAPAQRQIIEDLLTQGVKGIAVSPNDAGNQVEFFKNDVAPRVPLITQDSDLPDPSARRCYIGTDNYKAGRAAGDLVKKVLPGGGKIAIYVGQLDAQNAVERRQGVVDALADKEQAKGEPEGSFLKFGKYTLIDTFTDGGNEQECQRKVEDTLTKYPDVQCLVGLWAYNPPAMLRAVKAANKQGKIAIVAFDENDETLQGIKDGYIYATVVQNPFEFGYQAIRILASLARGDDSVLKGKDVDAEKRIYVPHRIIGKDNVEQFWAELNKLKGK
jgi:ribose transport system substrate-binding protein